MCAAQVATAHGADRLATSIKASLTRHVGRHDRVSTRVDRPNAAPNSANDAAYVFARRILEADAK
ncbi:hypothetical protein RGUI_1077 [Rhodovulum sp. P5]|nr:hypothetical protein RGUI_1077 [Rhodovulum sp. P5]